MTQLLTDKITAYKFCFMLNGLVYFTYVAVTAHQIITDNTAHQDPMIVQVEVTKNSVAMGLALTMCRTDMNAFVIRRVVIKVSGIIVSNWESFYKQIVLNSNFYKGVAVWLFPGFLIVSKLYDIKLHY